MENVKSKETVVLVGDANDPAIKAAARRIEDLGRSVEIVASFDINKLGPCGLHYCSCTTLCKSIIHQSYNPQ